MAKAKLDDLNNIIIMNNNNNNATNNVNICYPLLPIPRETTCWKLRSYSEFINYQLLQRSVRQVLLQSSRISLTSTGSM